MARTDTSGLETASNFEESLEHKREESAGDTSDLLDWIGVRLSGLSKACRPHILRTLDTPFLSRSKSKLQEPGKK